MTNIPFALKDFFELLRDRRWHDQEEIKFYANGREGPSSEVWSQAIQANGSLAMDTILHLKASKASIYVKRAELMHQALREMAADLARSGYFTVTFSLMYSPAGALSTPNHIDPCDVLAVQLHGQKSWTVDSAARVKDAHPLQSDPRPDNFAFINAAEYTTQVGNALFIPRGFVHNAMASEVDSLHLVISLMPLTWRDVMAHLIQDLCDTNTAFRSSVLAMDDHSDSEVAGVAVASWLRECSEPQALRHVAQTIMRKRAKAHMLSSFGQMFAKTPTDFE
ncbi:MAG: cupin domain-containing protein [Erythrobacter sp.]